MTPQNLAARMETRSELLRVDDLTVRFGGVVALDAVSIAVCDGEVCAVIGPNGAGKTTLFNAITGLYAPTDGGIQFGHRDLLRTPRRQLASLGISRTFQNLGLFKGLTALENVMVGAYSRSSGGFLASALRLPRARASERDTRERCLEIMRGVEIDTVGDKSVDGLPYGTLKRIELARALAARPRLLLLDEPAAGLAQREVDDLVDLLNRLKGESALTIVVVEHHMRLVMSLSDRVVALNFGRVLADGAPQTVATHPAVVEAYLGSRA